MSFSLFVFALLVVAGLLYWFPVRAWYRRSGAGHLDPYRAMSGDADVLTPDYESTLTIQIDARPPDVWPRLLEMGRSRRSQRTGKDTSELKVGDVIRLTFAPDFPITSIDPGRTLVLGGNRAGLQWRWQFELYPLDADRTRLISRARLRTTASLGSTIKALLLQPVSFVIMRKMLLDVKVRAEDRSVDSKWQIAHGK